MMGKRTHVASERVGLLMGWWEEDFVVLGDDGMLKLSALRKGKKMKGR